MMLTSLIRRQLKFFAVISVLAIGFTALTYADLARMLGLSGYTVSADFADPSGLYPRANVTYRGVTVGRVGDLALTADGVRVSLELEGDHPVPSNVRAELHSTSAIGEQYVDLVPSSDSSTNLADGDVIPQSRTRDMPQIAPVLDRLNGLLESVPAKATRSALNQVDQGLGGAGGDIADVVDESSSLLTEAQTQVDATTGLINALDPMLATQEQLGSQTQAYFGSLALLTDQLIKSDDDVDGLVREAPRSLEDLTDLIDDVGPSLPSLLSNTRSTLEPVEAYHANLEQSLVIYPALLARIQSALNPRAPFGDVKLDLTSTVNNPGSCSEGYLPVNRRRSPANTNIRKVNGWAHCQPPGSSPEGIRGLRNLPCPNSSRRAATPAECGLVFRGALPVSGSTRNVRPVKGDWPWISLLTGPLGL
jgi:phospholipid/cholesterol/gamma-HCH transport system substrate-binding protein